MSLRIAVFTDTHVGYRGAKEQVFAMLQEEVNVIRAERPDIVIHLGDMFDTPHIDSEAIKRVRD